jgi:hypothetical protein
MLLHFSEASAAGFWGDSPKISPKTKHLRTVFWAIRPKQRFPAVQPDFTSLP